jgi:hypothetical protein
MATVIKRLKEKQKIDTKFLYFKNKQTTKQIWKKRQTRIFFDTKEVIKNQ